MNSHEVKAMVEHTLQKESPRIHKVLEEENSAIRKMVENMRREVNTLDGLLKSWGPWGDWNRKCFRS